jgi:hypothetical protein
MFITISQFLLHQNPFLENLPDGLARMRLVESLTRDFVSFCDEDQ